MATASPPWQPASARPRCTGLEPATNLYRGDFLADEPYAEWALAERDRFQELAGRALRALIELRLAVDDLEGAARHARRLADTEPYDNDAQRRRHRAQPAARRRTEAVRRQALPAAAAAELRHRTRFHLAELSEGDPNQGSS